MIPVYQDRFGFGQGNCAWACVASIFELDIETLRLDPPYSEDLLNWTRAHQPGYTFHNVDLGRNYRVEEGFPDVEGVGTGRWTYDVPTEWDAPPSEFWMGTIFSPGLKRPVEDPYYPMPALHAVVMQGRHMVHDPNPRYGGPTQDFTLVQKTWWELQTPRQGSDLTGA